MKKLWKQITASVLKLNQSFSNFFQKELLLQVFASTFLFGVAAHGYCYFNLSYSHDSLLIFQENDISAQISIGRYLLPIYLKVRGNLYAPWLTGMLSLLYLSCAVYIVLRLLEIKNRLLRSLCCGVLAVNITLTLTNATYLKDADVYMLALFLSAAAVYLWARVPYGIFPAAFALCLSLGLYQAFFQAAVFLSMVCIVKIILERADTKTVLLSGITAIAALLLGLILYSIVLRFVLCLSGSQLFDGYNGLSQVGRFGSLSDMLQLIDKTYDNTLSYFRNPEIFHRGWMSRLNLLLTVVSAALLIRLAFSRKVRGLNLILLTGAVLLMPFGINVICFISQGMEHLLMIFSFFFAYIFSVMLLDIFLQDAAFSDGPVLRYTVYGTVCFILVFFIFNSIILSNQIYLKKHLEYQTTLLTMNRIINRIEQTEGYTAGETPVALIGNLSDSVLSKPRAELSNLTGIGLESNLSVTYPATYHWYLQNLLSYPIALLSAEDCSKLAERSDVTAMPVYPATGSCTMSDGIVIVKLS